MLTEASGHLEIDVPRDRAGTFEPQIVKKRQRRLSGVDEIVLSLNAKGLTTGEIRHFAEIYGASMSEETIASIILSEAQHGVRRSAPHTENVVVRALRQLANRLVGILHGCLKTNTLYDENTAWQHHHTDTQPIAA